MIGKVIDDLMWLQAHSTFRRKELLDGSDICPVDVPTIFISLLSVTRGEKSEKSITFADDKLRSHLTGPTPLPPFEIGNDDELVEICLPSDLTIDTGSLHLACLMNAEMLAIVRHG